MIRRLGPGDTELLREICRQFKERAPSEAEAAAFLATDWAVTFVALDDSGVAGFAYGYVLPRIDGDTSVFFYELEVAPRCRGLGFGRALAEEMRRVAESAGALKMWVQTDEENEAAKRTYASAGAVRAGPNLLFEWRFRD